MGEDIINSVNFWDVSPGYPLKMKDLAYHFKPAPLAAPAGLKSIYAVPTTKPENAKNNSFDYGSFIPAAIQFGANAYNSFQYDRSADDLMRDAGNSYSSIGGQGYSIYNNIDRKSELSQVSKETTGNIFKGAATGATAGMMFGPVGGAIGAVAGGLISGIGGIFRRNKAKDEIREAQERIDNYNNFNREYALSNVLQQDFAKKYGNPEDQVLFTENGKDMNITTNIRKGLPKLTQFAEGFGYAVPNGFGKGGEIIGKPEKAEWDFIPGDKKDNKPLYLTKDTVVLTDKDNIAKTAAPSVEAIKEINSAIDNLQYLANRSKSDEAKDLASRVIKASVNKLQEDKEMHNQRLTDIADAQATMREYGLLGKEKYAPIHADNGFDWGNLITGVAGGLTGLSQYFGAQRQKIKSPNTFYQNPYALRALNDLDSLRYNPKPTIDAINNDAAAALYSINNSGGLNAAQRHLAKVASTYNTQLAKSKVYADASLQNNQYRTTASQAKLQAGAQEASNRIQTGQWDLDNYSKAHAARLQGMQMGTYNWINALQQYIANANKLGMFRDMYGLYYAKLNDDQRKALRDLNLA